MSELKVSEGEWKVDRIPHGYLPYQRIVSEWKPVARVCRKDEEAVANANMLAASKEMYEALESIIWLIDEGQIVESEPSHVGPLKISEARQALAKAEGKQCLKKDG